MGGTESSADGVWEVETLAQVKTKGWMSINGDENMEPAFEKHEESNKSQGSQYVDLKLLQHEWMLKPWRGSEAGEPSSYQFFL